MKTRDQFWKKIPPLSLAIFLLGVFFIFGIIGSAVDVITMGRQSTTRYLVSVVLFGLFAIVYAISGTVLRRNSWKVILPVMLVQMFVMGLVLRALPIPRVMGAGEINRLRSRLVLDGGMTIGGMVLAYVCFIYVFISEGRRYFAVHAEMELASEIHRVLVPDVEMRIGSFELFGRSVPSGQVGGDLIDVVENGDKWIAYIADVSGHGVAPGVLMGMVKSAARMYLSSDEGSDRFLERLNSVLNPIRKPEMFVTMAFLAWDGSQLLAFSTAGHPPILHYCQETRVIKELLCSNLPVGMFAPQEFASDTVSPRQADVFVLFTDGLLEVTNKSGAEFGLEGIKAVLSSSEHETLRALADRILQAARAFGHTDDDESLLVVKC